MAKKILFITLSNIGDAILTLPALDRLKSDFPDSSITVLGSEKSSGIFLGSPLIDKFIPYDKRAGLKDKFKLFLNLNKEDFGLVVDLKDTFLGFILKARSGTLSLSRIPAAVEHMKERHLYRAGYRDKSSSGRKSFYISADDQRRIACLLSDAGIGDKDKVIVISAGARSNAKRWPKEKFAELSSRLIEEFNARIILVGDKEDQAVSRYINNSLKGACLDLSAKTTLRELACVLQKSGLVISNDSAVMHMASYLDIPTLAIFGITDDRKYAPWSKESAVAKKEICCRPCQKAQCRFGTLKCLSLVKVDDVLRQARDISNHKQVQGLGVKGPDRYKRILVIRTDRIGDVLLSTPAIKALRENYPHAFIAAMVSPYAKEIVEGNPSLDEAILYDKDGKHKGWASSVRFARNLRRHKFDVAIILHPTNRAHLTAYLAGIPKRIGYDRKFGFLLTDKICHTKQLGEKHELEYNLDLLRLLGIEAKNKGLFIPIKAGSERWAEEFISSQGIKKGEKFLAINPSASCPSKVWPFERFAEVSDKLAQKYGFRVLVISGPKDLALAEKVIKNMKSPAISVAGKVSLSQLASLLKRASLFISNDSGPVHIASAVGTPVISIFGRKQAGLSPRRWGPVGPRDKVLHKDTGCIECLAHNCRRGFACLKAISVEDVISCADSILKT